MTPAYCKGISAGGNTCSANSELTACVEIKAACTGYASTPWADCLSGSEAASVKCIINAAGDGCEAFSSGCSTVKLFKAGATAITYTNAICDLYGCQAKADGSGCEDKTVAAAAPVTCTSYTGTLTYEACIGFLNTCSVNAAKTACVTA